MKKIEVQKSHEESMAFNSLNDLLKQAVIVHKENPNGPFSDKRIEIRAVQARVDPKAVARIIR